ncbi:gag-Pol polyprotein [Trichonephila clavipes]|nr:gag-Pol polyprotein [Trichonephila clavipes]
MREEDIKYHHDAPTAAHYVDEMTEGMKWIFIVEDYTTKWVELFLLKQATAKECAMTLLNEVFLRYEVPRRLISDNGTQFVSTIHQRFNTLSEWHSISSLPVVPLKKRGRPRKQPLIPRGTAGENAI